jgi:hypothetical protein
MKFRHHDNQECIDKMWKEANKKLKQVSDREERMKRREWKERLKTKSDYEGLLQKEVNLICRLLDKSQKCISSNRPLGNSFDAGHLASRGSAPTIRFHCLNIWAQSVEQNQHKSGNPMGFIEGLKELFGIGVVDEILSLKVKYPVLKLTVEEIQEATKIARQIVKELKQDDLVYTTEERLTKRREYNKRLNIYKE